MPGHPTSDRLGPPDLKVAGLRMWVIGREFDDASDNDDYCIRWLRVVVHADAPGASVCVEGAFLTVTDLEGWAGECEALVNGEAQEADLMPFEAESLEVRIRQVNCLGHFAMSVEITPDDRCQKHWFEFGIDQTHLREMARQCRSIVRAHTLVRGPDRAR